MSSLSFVTGVSVILLLSAVCLAQDYDYTPPPDYDSISDSNDTIGYSFYSNTSAKDLETFLEQFTDWDQEEDGDTGGWREGEGTTVTAATTQGTTETSGVSLENAASLPVCLDIRTLFWTLVILISLNLRQLQHTL